VESNDTMSSDENNIPESELVYGRGRRTRNNIGLVSMSVYEYVCVCKCGGESVAHVSL
jgi:hypothetical protein